MERFKKGQRVMLVNLRDLDPCLPGNTLGNRGVVVRRISSEACIVDWDDGTTNAYVDTRLAPEIIEDNV